jgi:hypothetical protein
MVTDPIPRFGAGIIRPTRMTSICLSRFIDLALLFSRWCGARARRNRFTSVRSRSNARGHIIAAIYVVNR